MSSGNNGPVDLPETDEEWDKVIAESQKQEELEQQMGEDPYVSGLTKPTEPNPSVNAHSTDPNAPLPEGVLKKVMGMAIPTREKQLEDYEKYKEATAKTTDQNKVKWAIEQIGSTDLDGAQEWLKENKNEMDESKRLTITEGQAVQVHYVKEISEEEFETKIIEGLAEIKGMEVSEIMDAGGMDAHLVRDLDVDSLDAIELIMDAEDMLGAQIENTEIMWVKTLRDVFTVIQYKINNDNMPYPIPEFDEEDIIFRPQTVVEDGKEVHKGNSAYKSFMAGAGERAETDKEMDEYLAEEEERERKMRELLEEDDDDLSVGHNK